MRWVRVSLFNNICVFLLVSTLTSGCATIVNSPHQNVPVSSYPSGAEVIVDGLESFITPTTLKLKRKNDHTLLFKKSGYEDLVFEITRAISGAVAGNILAGGLIGIGVDAMSGAANKLVPEAVNVTLIRTSASAPHVAPSVSTPAPKTVPEKSAEQKSQELTDPARVTVGNITPSRSSRDVTKSMSPRVSTEPERREVNFYDKKKIINLYKLRRITMAEYNKAINLIDDNKGRDANTYITKLMKYR